MVHCPYCGREIETLKAPKFCTYCGSDLTGSAQKPMSFDQYTQKQRSIKPSPSYRPWLVIIGGCATIFVIFFFIILSGILFLGSLFGPSLGSGIEIYSDADFKEYSSSGTGTFNDPYILSNYTLTDQFYGFTIQNTTKYFIITKCEIEICYEGIRIENVAPGTASIVGNEITYLDCWVWETGPSAGITVHSSPGINISNNIIRNAGIEGILIENSEKCYLSNNTISEQYIGISLNYSNSTVINNNTLFKNSEALICYDSHFVNITNNICNSNGYSSMNIISSSFVRIINNICFNNTDRYWYSSGIMIEESDNCTVTNCSVIKCHRGIDISSSSSCQIFYNHFENNLEYGVSIFWFYKEALFNTIYYNSFIDNNPNGVSQALDNGTSNYWYIPELEQGNYWSDWNGNGYYQIAGTANASDRYPLSVPPV